MIRPVGYPQRLANLIQQLSNSNTLAEVAPEAQAVLDHAPHGYFWTQAGLDLLQNDARVSLSKPAVELVLFIQWMQAQGIAGTSASDGAAALAEFGRTLGSLFGTSKADAEITQRAFAAAWAGRDMPLRPRALYTQTIHYRPGNRSTPPSLPVPVAGLEIPANAHIEATRNGSVRPGRLDIVTEYIYVTFAVPGSSKSTEEACLKFDIVTNTERRPPTLESDWHVQEQPLARMPGEWLRGLERFLAARDSLPGFGPQLLQCVRATRGSHAERLLANPGATDVGAIVERLAEHLPVGRLNHPDLNALARLAAEQRTKKP